MDLLVISVSASRAQVGDLLAGRREIGLRRGSRLSDREDLGLEPIDEMSTRLGLGLKRGNLLGVPGPQGIEVGLVLGLEPAPLGLDSLEMIGPGFLELAF